MATICPLCGSSVEEGEICSCQQGLQVLANEAVGMEFDLGGAPAPAADAVQEFDVGTLTPKAATEQKPEEFAPLERFDNGAPTPEPLPPEETAAEETQPIEEFDIGVLTPPAAPAIEPKAEEFAPLERIDEVMQTEVLSSYEMPVADEIPPTVEMDIPPTEEMSLAQTEAPAPPTEDAPVLQAEETSTIEFNVTEPPAPTLVYENQEGEGVALDVSNPSADGEVAASEAYTMTASDIEDYTVQTLLGEEVTRDMQESAVAPTQELSSQEPPLQESGSLQEEAPAPADEVKENPAVEELPQTEVVSYTERHKEQERIIRERAGLPPLEEEPEEEPVREQEPSRYYNEPLPAQELPPCPENIGELIGDARVEPVTTAMRFAATGKQPFAIIIIVLHGILMGLFTAVFSMRLSSIYGYSLSFEEFNNGKFMLAMGLAFVLSVAVYMAMSAAMAYVLQEYTAQAEMPVLMRSVSMQALVLIPFLLLGCLICLINPIIAVPVFGIGYGLGSCLMGYSLEGMRDVGHDEALLPVLVGTLIHAIGILLLLIFVGIVIF